MSSLQATAAIEGFLASFIAAAAATSQAEVARWQWNDVVPGTSAVQALKLLGCLEPTAQLYFSRSFELSDGHMLKPSWSLGHYIGFANKAGP